MCEVFPKGSNDDWRYRIHYEDVVFAAVAVCRYQRYGRGGGQETKGALCVLSLNMINDKVRTSTNQFSVKLRPLLFTNYICLFDFDPEH